VDVEAEGKTDAVHATWRVKKHRDSINLRDADGIAKYDFFIFLLERLV
jgi:hypothetical protein